MVNQRVIQKVSAKNTGARPQYVRVKVKKEWLDNKEAVTEREGQKLNKDYIGINYVNTNDWIYVSPSGNDDDPDGYLYYKKIVAPGESTSDFMDAYTVLLGVNVTLIYTGICLPGLLMMPMLYRQLLQKLPCCMSGEYLQK